MRGRRRCHPEAREESGWCSPASTPQTKLLAIEIDCEVAPPAVLPSAALAAIDHALPNLGDVQVDGDAFLSPFIAQPAPVAGEARARPEIAGVRIFGHGILRANPCADRDSEHSQNRHNDRKLFHRSCSLF